MEVKSHIHASQAKYIKLGEKGVWEALCRESGDLRLGYYEVPHDYALKRDKEAITDLYIRRGLTKGASSSHARQVQDFYHADEETIWITFADGCLWWCKAKGEVELLGYDEEEWPNGSRVRQTAGGWKNASIGGQLLEVTSLSGNLTKVAAYRQTICDVKGQAFEYLLRKINDETLPEVDAAIATLERLEEQMAALIKLLTWQDFELFIDVLFSHGGWEKISITGGTQKTVDLELKHSFNGEKAAVQVKSETSQSQLDDYIGRLESYPADRKYYVYHSCKQTLDNRDSDIILLDGNVLAQRAVKLGLVDWLIDRVD